MSGALKIQKVRPTEEHVYATMVTIKILLEGLPGHLAMVSHDYSTVL